MERQVNKKRLPADLEVDDMAWLATTNLHLPSNFSRKFAAKWIGPYRVLAKVGAVACRLELPGELQRLHPVFHASLLKKAVGDTWQKEPIFREDTNVLEYEV